MSTFRAASSDLLDAAGRVFARARGFFIEQNNSATDMDWLDRSPQFGREGGKEEEENEVDSMQSSAEMEDDRASFPLCACVCVCVR